MSQSVSATDNVQLSVDRGSRGVLALAASDVTFDVTRAELNGPLFADDRFNVLLDLAPQVGQGAVLVVDVVLDDELAQIGNRELPCPQADELSGGDFT